MVGIGSPFSTVVIYFVDNFYGQNLQAQLSGGCEWSQDLISGFSKCCGSLGFMHLGSLQLSVKNENENLQI